MIFTYSRLHLHAFSWALSFLFKIYYYCDYCIRYFRCCYCYYKKWHFTVLFMQEASKSDSLIRKHINLEFASFSDGKEAVVKAANYLYKKNYIGGEQKEFICTESHIDEALKAIGTNFLFTLVDSSTFIWSLVLKIKFFCTFMYLVKIGTYCSPSLIFLKSY